MDVYSLDFISAQYRINLHKLKTLVWKTFCWYSFQVGKLKSNVFEVKWTFILIHWQYISHLVRNCFKGAKVGAFNQVYESSFSESIFNTKTNKKLNHLRNHHQDFYRSEKSGWILSYSDFSIREKIGQLWVSRRFTNVPLERSSLASDATSVHLSAMYSPASIYLKIETG